MTIDKDDPRITAYALNELPAEEAAAVEEALGNDPALRAEVESIRATATALQTALRAEPLPVTGKGAPEVEQSPAGSVVGSGAAAERKPGRWNRRILFYAACGAAAACFVCVVGLSSLTGRTPVFCAAVDEIGGSQEQGAASTSIRTDGGKIRFYDVNDEKGMREARERGEKFGIVTAPATYKNVQAECVVEEKAGRKSKDYSAGGKVGTAPNTPQATQQPAVPSASQAPAKVYPVTGYIASETIAADERKRAEDQLSGDVKEAMIKPEEMEVRPGDWQKMKERAEALKKEQFREQSEASNTEAYDKIVENEFLRVSEQPLSTFSIDVDTASYSNLRRQLTAGTLPPAGSVRIEEMINYFDYDYAPPQDGTPFATHAALAQCPWNPEHTLLRVGLKGKVIAEQERPACNLIFLLDVSGSMNDANKLPLVREGMKLLVNRLNENDRVAIAVYAGASGLVLPSTPCSQKEKIMEALDRLQAGGSTNGAEGIRLAYATAAGSFLEKGVNRVILCTDGDFNVGMTNQSDLTDLIEKKAKEKVFLTVLGFGMGNYKDSTLEKLADKGNGNYGYIDSLNEAKKLLVDQLSGTLVTIAKDVKIQIEFNPAAVQAYRLIGYENRKLNKEDFNDDKKDAGEIGAGHTVTALYELVPAGAPLKLDAPQVDPLKYQKSAEKAGDADEVLTLKLRYKEPEADVSKLLSFPIRNKVAAWEKADGNTRFAASVAAFGMLLRGSQFAGNADFAKVIEWATTAAKIQDRSGYRAEFVQLVRTAASLRNR